MSWPSEFESASALAEVPTPKGRIDLLVTGRANGHLWGAVVEAKFGHHLDANPLSDYDRYACKLGLAIPNSEDGQRTGVLTIVGQARTHRMSRRLRGNRRWTFLGWEALLKRFERELETLSDDPAFRQCRRTIWERAT